MALFDMALYLVPKAVKERFGQAVQERARQVIDERSGQAVQEQARRVSGQLVENPSLSAKLIPYQADNLSYLVPPPNRDGVRLCKAGLPIPPENLWWGYAKTSEEYLAGGKAHVERMRSIVSESGFSFKEGGRLLELGCAAGRMLRWFHDLSGSCEVWGADISAEHVLWCQQYLTPPFRFTTMTTFPHLPFADSYFDFIYAGSVFTHIADLADAWLLELRRVLQPDGRIYVSIFDNHVIDTILSWPDDPTHFGYWLRNLLLSFAQTSRFREAGFNIFTINRGPLTAETFIDRGYIRQVWGSFFSRISFHEEGYGFQTGLLLGK